MVKFILAVLLAVMLVGCSTKVVVVKVPIPIHPPRPELPVKPELSSINNENLPDDVFVRNISEDFIKLLSYSNKLENLLKVYLIDIDKKYTESLGKESSFEVK
jgi:hypothetical protein